MNRRWLSAVSITLVVFGCLAVVWHPLHYEDRLETVYPSIIRSAVHSQILARNPVIFGRDYTISYMSGADRYLDLTLPPQARVFITDMTGPTNFNKVMYYYSLTYYLFPREVGTSLDHVTHITKDGLCGRTSKSDAEIRAAGYDARIDIDTNQVMHLGVLGNLEMRDPANPDWFNSTFDLFIAFFLPLLTALAGKWLFRFLFPSLDQSLPLSEQLAYSLGLGMLAVGGLTLGVKLCGFHGYYLVYSAVCLSALAELWLHRKTYEQRILAGYQKLLQHPVALAISAVGLLVFLVLFRLAGLQGVMEYDAVMAWMLKAKIIHLCAGGELVRWFSTPGLALAHLDYPTLVPSLHAATFDSLGHVNEFVTKFWPAWMLFFLLAALAALCRGGTGRFYSPYFALLGLLLLPGIQKSVQFEGGILPMIFFTVLGLIQCAAWQVDKDRVRLGLGFTLLFGSAMTKFEGFIFLAWVMVWLLLVPAVRSGLRPSAAFRRLAGFWLLAALPFACLRLQIPTVNYESGWASYVLQHPAATLVNSPRVFVILILQWFLNYDFARWSGAGGQLHWIGRWEGWSSLYHHPTLGLAWLCLLLTIALWFTRPARRGFILWLLGIIVSIMATFSVVFSSFIRVTGLDQVMGYTTEQGAGRYLLPLLVGWFGVLLLLFFRPERPGADDTAAISWEKSGPGRPSSQEPESP
jgi:hypothetical protein